MSTRQIATLPYQNIKQPLYLSGFESVYTGGTEKIIPFKGKQPEPSAKFTKKCDFSYENDFYKMLINLITTAFVDCRYKYRIWREQRLK